MAEFAEYYINFLKNLLENIYVFFRDRILTWVHIFSNDIPGYFGDLAAAIPNFDIFGWIVFIFITLINGVLIFFLIYRLVQLLRRFIFFRSKEVEKDELLEELARAKDEIARLNVEKNQLYALKLNSAFPQYYNEPVKTSSFPSSENALIPQNGVKETVPAKSASRFDKLGEVDKKYELDLVYPATQGIELLTLSDLVDRFVNFAASQLHLYYKKDTVRCFFAGMATTKLLILEGISGTGKTSLPYSLSKFFSNISTIVSVQPSWRDRADLLGYFNEFTKTYNETEFLRAVYEARYKEDPTFIVLDEMNLARIEYYFAEFLSVMELPEPSKWLVDIVPTVKPGDPKNLEDGKLLVPQNLWFVGTANRDDSTFTITDKVYDRTVAIDLNERGEYFDAPLTESIYFTYDRLELLFQKARAQKSLSQSSWQALGEIDNYLIDNFKITFGNRIKNQISAFVPVYVAAGGKEEEGLDFMLQSKILRKLSSLNLSYLTKELNGLSALIEKKFGKNKFNKSQEYIKSLLRLI